MGGRFGSLVSCRMIMVGLFCMVSISYIMHGRLELMWPIFCAIIWACVVVVYVGCVCRGGCVSRVTLGFGVNLVMG